MTAAGMPAGYAFLPQPNDVAGAVLGKSTWAVLALTCHIELFIAGALPQSIEPDDDLVAAVEGRVPVPLAARSRSTRSSTSSNGCARTPSSTPRQRDQAVDDLIDLVGAVDGICRCRPGPTPSYFVAAARTRVRTEAQAQAIEATMLAAYRWQYIISGVQEPRFLELLGSMIDAVARARASTPRSRRSSAPACSDLRPGGPGTRGPGFAATQIPARAHEVKDADRRS